MTGAIVWFTGLPASGKTTLGAAVRDELTACGTLAVLLDSDELRHALRAQSYDEASRDAFYDVLGDLALILARQGHIVLVAATAPKRAYRDRVRAEAPRFVEVWVATPLAQCQQHDVKGLYARARGGDASRLPGLGVTYEPPQMPEVVASGGFDRNAIERIVEALALVRPEPNHERDQEPANATS